MGLLTKLTYKLAGLPELHKDFRHRPGGQCRFDHFSHTDGFGVVFEDDGDTGYFYALEFIDEERGFEIVEAMHIYDSSEADLQQRCLIAIAFSSNGLRACLTVQARPVAIFDFGAKRGYCRNNFPEPKNWGDSFDWDNSAFEAFEETTEVEQSDGGNQIQR